MPRPVAVLLAALFLFSSRANASIEEQADICIYGGTSAGVVAAVQAARMGKKVVLVERGAHLGGMSVEGLGGTDIDNHPGFQNSPAVGGLALEFYRRINRHYGRADRFEAMLLSREKNPGLWRFEPKVAAHVWDRWIQEHPVRVLRGHALADGDPVEKDGTRVLALRCANGTVVRAAVFIDATYEGDLLAAAGVSTTIGREGRDRYDETKNGVQLSATHRALDRRIDPYRRPGDVTSGLIHSVQDAPIGIEGAPDASVQAFCFRLCLTDDPANRIPIRPPPGYDPAHYEVQRRYLAAGGIITPPAAALPNRKTDPGSWHKLAGNMPGMNDDYLDAPAARRAEIVLAARHYVQGLLWFLAQDSSVPATLRAQWGKWGLTRDEFIDNGGWPRLFYVRNGRRMVGEYVMTYAHGRRADPVPVEDPVGLVWWPHDLHEARRLVRDGAVWHEGTVFDAAHESDWIPFGISYRALVPRKSECENLLTPTCPSSSYVAYGAYRIEYQFMVAGQSVATAAALAIDGKVAVQEVSYENLRARLHADGQVLAPPSKLGP